MNSRTPSLAFCVIMDLIGYASYAIPVVGELTDAVWAPISGLIFFLAFRGWKGAIGGIFDMVEELLPGTDFIPTFTIMWFIRKWQSKSQISNFKSQTNLKSQISNLK
jgi:hypothetical protein